jgi:predicted ATPase
MDRMQTARHLTAAQRQVERAAGYLSGMAYAQSTDARLSEVCHRLDELARSLALRIARAERGDLKGALEPLHPTLERS